MGLNFHGNHKILIIKIQPNQKTRPHRAIGSPIISQLRPIRNYLILFKSMIVFTTVSGFRLIESMPSFTRKRAKSM